MRILIVNKFAHVTGGADLHCLDLAQALRERGHEVSFLSTRDADNRERSGAFVPAAVDNASRGGLGGLPAVRVAARALWNSTAAAAMRRLLEEFRPDVAHAHKLYPQLSVAPIAVASRSSTAVIQTVHDYEFVSASPIDHTGGRLDGDEEKLSYRALNSALFAVKRSIHVPAVDTWVSVSRAVGARYEEHGIETTSIPNFIGATDAPMLPRGQRDGVLFVGRLTPEKGIDDFLRMAEELPGLRFLVAGSGTLAAAVEERCGRLPSVEFLGGLSNAEVMERVRNAMTVVMPSRWQEPGPLTALEAMSMGTPLVVYDNGGLAEYVRDADGGLISPPNPAGLAQAVRRVCEGEVLWNRLAENGYAAARRTHTIDAYMDSLEEVYSAAVAAKKT